MCFRTNRSCRLAPAHQGMKKGSGVVCATHPAPSWGQAPALHFSCDAGLSLLGRRWLVSPASAGIHPGSESGTRFRSNRSCLLVPAHQGVKSRSCGLVQRIGTADSATPHPDPCGGQAPALHFLIPPSATGLQVGTFRPLRAGIEVDWRAHPGSESGTCFRTNRLCRLAPAHQGMKKGSGVVCATHPAPSWGQAPALRGFPSVPQAGFKPATTVGYSELRKRSNRCRGTGHALTGITRQAQSRIGRYARRAGRIAVLGFVAGCHLAGSFVFERGMGVIAAEVVGDGTAVVEPAPGWGIHGH